MSAYNERLKVMKERILPKIMTVAVSLFLVLAISRAGFISNEKWEVNKKSKSKEIQ